MVNHWVNSYVGRPWVAGARGPDAFDCWGLLCDVYAKHYGIKLEHYAGVDPKDTRKVSRLLAAATDGQPLWKRLQTPSDGCAVAMSTGRAFHHVGVWLDLDKGIVLHAMDRLNVLAQSLSGLRSLGITRIEFYAYVPANLPRNESPQSA